MISSLKQRNEMTTTAEQKTKIIFQTYFSSSLISTLFAKNISSYDYSQLMKKDELIIKREIMKAIYKTTLNKTSDVNEVTNRALRHFIEIAASQMRSLFERYYRKKIQSTHFKRSIIIILRKFEKKNYSELKLYKSIALLNILNKTLESIISKRL